MLSFKTLIVSQALHWMELINFPPLSMEVSQWSSQLLKVLTFLFLSWKIRFARSTALWQYWKPENYDNITLAALGLSASFVVIGDITPPSFNGFYCSPMTVDARTSPATTNCYLNVTDDNSGVIPGSVTFQLTSPTGATVISGYTSLDSTGLYVSQVFVDQYSDSGKTILWHRWEPWTMPSILWTSIQTWKTS